jgi:hypothetical protein
MSAESRSSSRYLALLSTGHARAQAARNAEVTRAIAEPPNETIWEVEWRERGIDVISLLLLKEVMQLAFRAFRRETSSIEPRHERNS